jgi:hypothetical protein
MLDMSEPPRLPKAPPLLDAPPPGVTVTAPLGVCLIGAAVGWVLVAGCYALIAMDANSHGPDAWASLFGDLGLYPSVPFAVVTTVLTVIFAFLRRVPRSVRTTVVAVLAPIEALVGLALLLVAAVAFFPV